MTAETSGTFRYRKRPVVVEARRVGPANFRELAGWCGGSYGFRGGVPAVEITTLEGTMTAPCGDWVIKGIAGEFHPVRDDIFRRTYDRADGLEGKTPGQAVYEAHQAFMIRCFPGIAPIGWSELSVEAQAGWEGIAQAGAREAVAAADARAEAAEAAKREARGELAALGNRLAASIAVAVKAERERAEAAEAKVAQAREGIGNFLGQYGDSEIPMFKVAQDLANSLLKILGAPAGEASGG